MTGEGIGFLIPGFLRPGVWVGLGCDALAGGIDPDAASCLGVEVCYSNGTYISQGAFISLPLLPGLFPSSLLHTLGAR